MEGEEREGGVGCGACRSAGARGPALAKDGPEEPLPQMAANSSYTQCTLHINI